MKSIGLTMAVGLLASCPAVAGDMRLEATGLGWLTENADLVAWVHTAEPIPVDRPTVQVYRLGLGEVLDGEAISEATAFVVAAVGFDSATTLRDHVVVLRGPLGTADLERVRLAIDGPVYEILGGRFGVARARNPDERKTISTAIADYLSARSAADRGNWVERHRESTVPLLRQTALLEPLETPDLAQQLVADSLVATVRSRAIPLGEKSLGVQVASARLAPSAAHPLLTLIKDRSVDPALRSEMMQTAAGLADDPQSLLESFAEDPDARVRETAFRLLAARDRSSLMPVDDDAPPDLVLDDDAIDRLSRLIRDPDVGSQQAKVEALYDLQKALPPEKLGSALQKIVGSGETASPVRINAYVALDSLGDASLLENLQLAADDELRAFIAASKQDLQEGN